MDSPKSVEATFATAGEHVWSKSFQSQAVGNGVAVDSAGNSIVVGSFRGDIDLGGGTLVSDNGTDDIFVAKLSPSGAHLWSKRFGASGVDEALAVAVGPNGDVVVVGDFNGTVNFGGGPLTTAGNVYGFALKLTGASGDHVWSKMIAGDLNYARGVAVGPSGDAVVAGQFQGMVDFGGGGVLAGGTDAFLAWYSAAGDYQRAVRIGGGLADTATAVATDAAGNVVVAGSYEGMFYVGGELLTDSGASDVFVIRYSSAGAIGWVRHFGGLAYDSARALAEGPNGDVTVAGDFGADMTIGSDTLGNAGGFDAFVVHLAAANGQVLWSRRMGASMDDSGLGAAVDGAGRVVIAGKFKGSVDFGGGPLSAGGGIADIFLASYSEIDGTPRWARAFGSAADTQAGEAAQAVTVDVSGFVVATGIFAGAVSFGGPILNATRWDAFIVKLAP